MNTKIIGTAAALLALCSTLHAQTLPAVSPALPASPAAPAGAPVTLRYKFAVGQVRRYEYDVDMTMNVLTGQTGAGIPLDMTTQTTMRQTVESIRPSDGAATIVIQNEAVRALRNGQEVPMSEEQQAIMKKAFTQVMLPNGKILSVKASMPGAAASGMDFTGRAFGSLGSTVALPEGQAKIGDTWNTTGTASGMGLDLASKSMLASLDQKNGTTLATIQTKQTGMINKPVTAELPVKLQGQLTGDVSQVFDMSAGALQSMKGSCSADMLMTSGKATDSATLSGRPTAMKMNMQMKYTMTRLGDTPPNATSTAPVQ